MNMNEPYATTSLSLVFLAVCRLYSQNHFLVVGCKMSLKLKGASGPSYLHK